MYLPGTCFFFFNLTVCLGSFSMVVHKVYLILLNGFCPTNKDEWWAAHTHTRASSVAFEGDSETGMSSLLLLSACLCTCHTCGSLEPHSGTLRCLASDWERHHGTGQLHCLGSPPWMAWGQGCAGAVVWPGLPGRLPCSGTTHGWGVPLLFLGSGCALPAFYQDVAGFHGAL